MRFNDTLNDVPDDWVYATKEAINYRLFSNPLIMSDMIDIVTDELYKSFGAEMISFEYHDAERTMTAKFTTLTDESKLLKQAVHSIMWRFCDKYKINIESALIERYGRGKYNGTFDLIMESYSTFLLVQLVTINSIYVKESQTMISSIRFY